MQILLTTVGGTIEPIQTTWNHLHPDKTYFICSEDDPLTGRQGTYVTIEKGADGGLASKLGLTSDQFEIVKVPADRPDVSYHIIHGLIDEIYRTFPDAEIAADYTGGTKSMSAALILAAIDYPQVNVFVVTGARTDFVKVQHGTHHTFQVPANRVYVEREFSLAMKHWEHYDYEAAARRLHQLIEGRVISDTSTDISRAKQLSMAFGFWDRFQYQLAYENLRPFAGTLSFLPKYIEQVHFLLDDEDPLRRDYLRIWDLWFNALRRAENARFDDGVARLYRLLEATAQWLLQHAHQIDTSQVLPSQLPSEFWLENAANEPLKIGLFEAWRLLREIDKGPLSHWISQEESHLRYYLNIRNESYLAHGHRPISEVEWHKWREWLEKSFLPALQEQGRLYGLKKIPEQLPRAWKEKT
ncbi:TIGR02710 family CRISPR-associated CARF protein [Sulfobacillus thermosulfidooxidans]|uniref:TIGR02710 family CRISPR-associated CARF protein n=1 Tax=Sulfobacillus thermosulfidooxidans TaxID=28034 RepID=UPI000400FA3E|nr:TIGR02710 family CRISPR-associated CARF protein [Sulfobacillus thermosulfidooxidans]